MTREELDAVLDAKPPHREARRALAEYIGREYLPVLDIDIAYTIWGPMPIRSPGEKDEQDEIPF